MGIDDSWRHDEAASIYLLPGLSRSKVAQMSDPAPFDPDVRSTPRSACTIDDCAATNDDVKLGHISSFAAARET
jgi:hypothetical protein